ncbi:hypothetical protein BKA70DRAFT_1223564 [Coprinopsis sp. MPI-PUGE-AT-0042]|nr:hypothetical protein BKA70DRAFT_1223564 [Coprinopsis sp. MPI-PUGE-AT-0042]
MIVPLEIFFHIISLARADRKALIRLRLACRAANSIIEPALFATISFANHGYGRVDSVEDFDKLVIGNDKIIGYIKRVSITTKTALKHMDILLRIFKLLKDNKGFCEVDFESEVRFEMFDGDSVYKLVKPVASQLTSVELNNVGISDANFLQMFPNLQHLTLLGVDGALRPSTDTRAKWKTSAIPHPTSFRYAQHSHSVRRAWDENGNYFRNTRRMSTPDPIDYDAHIDPFVASCNWSTLSDLHFETGFIQDIFVFAFVVPPAASTLVSLSIELSGLCRHWRRPEEILTSLCALPSLQELAVRTRSFSDSESDVENPLQGIALFLRKLNAPKLLRLRLLLWLQHLTSKFILSLDWSSLDTSIRGCREVSPCLVTTVQFKEYTELSYSFVSETPLSLPYARDISLTWPYDDGDLSTTVVPDNFIARYLPSCSMHT